MINNKSISKLEFSSIINRYLNYCKTSYGKEKFQKIEFYFEKKSLEEELNLLEEVVTYVRDGNFFPLSGIPDIRQQIEIIKKGLTLNVESAYNVFVFLRKSNILIDSIKKLKSEIFSKRFVIDYDFTPVVKSITNIFGEDGLISDNATKELFSIRKKLKKAQQDFIDITSSIAGKYREFLVSENYILKDDKFLLPVKINKKNNVNGIVFGLSDSGKTILIEPIEIVEINNVIYQLKAEQELEIGKILFDVTQIYLNHIGKIVNFISVIEELDFINAKASLAFEKGYNKIDVNEEYIFKLNQFYHPLLDNPVKNNLEFGKEKQFVVITGPNTGGKSVTLKAVGLIQLLFQAGFFTPTSAGSTLPIMDDILIDIGDLQSIENSLSTFSSHILELKNIIENASSRTLILIDELGTSTSPVEGEALAISIIQYLIDKKSFGIITSHFDKVKKFALDNEFTIITSMCFDEENMLPKFILVTDVPGYSYAFEIAQRLGIPSFIIERAKNLANEDKDSASVSKEISKLVLKYRNLINELNEKQNYLLKKEEEVELLKKKYQKTAIEIEKQIILQTNDKINDIKKMVEEEIYRLKKEGYSKEYSKKVINEIEKGKEEIIKDLKKYEISEEDKDIKEIDNFKIGDTVDTGIFGKKGKILQIDGDKAKIQVESFIFEVPLTKLIKKEKDKQQEINYSFYVPSKNLSSTIDIRGKTIEEARLDLNAYFSEIINSQYQKIYIIHGKGTGKLSSFVHEYLKEQKKVVKNFHYADLSEGGAGCTIVILKH